MKTTTLKLHFQARLIWLTYYTVLTSCIFDHTVIRQSELKNTRRPSFPETNFLEKQIPDFTCFPLVDRQYWSTELITLNLQNYYCSGGHTQRTLQAPPRRNRSCNPSAQILLVLQSDWTNLHRPEQKFTTARELKFCLWNRTSTPHQRKFQRKLRGWYFILITVYFTYSSLSTLRTEAQPTLLKLLFKGRRMVSYPPLLPLGWVTNIWTEPREKSDVTH